MVCSGKTGHCEAVEVDYDPTRVSYDKLLDVFWNEHSPTFEANVRGGQYRAVIFYHTPEQLVAATASKLRLEVKLGQKIYTKIQPAEKFWVAEDYHQDYYLRDNAGTCQR